MRTQSRGRKPDENNLDEGLADSDSRVYPRYSIVASAREFLQTMEDDWRVSQKRWEAIEEPDPVYGRPNPQFAATVADHFQTLRLLVVANVSLNADQQALVDEMVYEVARQPGAAENIISGARALRVLTVATYINSLPI